MRIYSGPTGSGSFRRFCKSLVVFPETNSFVPPGIAVPLVGVGPGSGDCLRLNEAAAAQSLMAPVRRASLASSRRPRTTRPTPNVFIRLAASCRTSRCGYAATTAQSLWPARPAASRSARPQWPRAIATAPTRHLKVVGRKEGLPELERLEIVLARAPRAKTKPCDVLAELIHDTLEEA
jgi:hypothetical protein